MTELVLVATVAVMAAVSASVGPAGGVVFATMALALPAPAVVPVHAVVQSGGSAIRFAVLRDHVDRKAVVAFVVGGTAGIVPAVLLVSRLDLDPDWLRLGLGAATLAPIIVNAGSRAAARSSASGLAGLGAWTSFLGVFVGATGPVVGSFLGRFYVDQRERVATHTGCVCFQHMAKIAVYAAVGFSFREYIPLIALLLAASAAGAFVGRRILRQANNSALRASFELLVIGLGCYLCVSSALTIWYRS